MSLIARSIIDAAEKSLSYGDRLLKDVTPAMAARFPSPGGKPVVTNHATFVFGHLALYPAKFLENAGRDASAAAVPQRYTDLFNAGVECKDDPSGTIYPPLEEVVSTFKRSHAALFKAMAEMTDADFAKAPAMEKSRAFLPTLAALGSFYFLAHTMMHLGQVSAWRRCMGLGAA